jgi:tetratricopeptide (TPR) repeat protein
VDVPGSSLKVQAERGNFLMRLRDFWLAGILLATIAAGVLLWLWSRPRPAEKPPDPRLSYPGPFANVRPEVAYVGDAVCASCHQDIADAYATHSMGRSMFPTQQAPAIEGLPDSASSEFRQGRLLYRVQRRDGKLYHAEAIVGSDAQPIAWLEEEAVYAVGSGTRGRTYLINRNGWLFESPISWYRHTGTWDLSPGYDKRNFHFERAIQPGCLFCHCNRAYDDPATVNRYRSPFVEGLVIGCERCHGPGQLHAERPRRKDGIDSSIVNPRHLSPELREDVCFQCHLQGEERIVKAGREVFDYRPGMPLHEFLAVFVKPPEWSEGQKAVSQAEQMLVSRCFQASQGRMGCTSCHDPHRLPPQESKASYYRQRCLSCHQPDSCSLPEPQRRQQSAQDSCTECHMPRLKSNIAHTALTDHRILRQPQPDSGRPPHPPPLVPGQVPLRHAYADRVDASRLDVGRDLAIAIVNLARKLEGQTPTVPYLRKAQPLLEAFLKRWPDDPPGWDALGYSLRKQGALAAAEQALLTSLRYQPEREQTLAELVELSVQSRRLQQALAYQRRLVAVNPYYSLYHLKLAELLHQDGQWLESNRACEDALRLNPTHEDARRLRIANFLRLGDARAADAEFARLVQIAPEHKASLESWYRGLQVSLR